MGTILTARSMVVVVRPSSPPLTHARILYENIFESATIVDSPTTESGFPASALQNPLTYESYKPTLASYSSGAPFFIPVPADIIFDTGDGVKANCLGIAAHTLGSTQTLVTYSVASALAGPYTDIHEFIPGDDKPIMILHDEVEGRYWRIRLEPTPGLQPQISVAYAGLCLEMQRAIYGSHSPITLSRVTAVRPNVSETGHWLGRSIIRKGLKSDFSWQHLTPDWYRLKFDPFVEAALIRPWFIAWRPETYPDEVAYCWTGQDIRPTNMGKGNLMEVSIQAEALDV